MLSRIPIPARVAIVAGVLTLAALRLYSAVAVAIVLFDGAVTAVIFAAAAGLGLVLTRPLLPPSENIATRFVISACLGAGAMALLVLGLGSFGVMNRVTWITIVTGLMACGAVVLFQLIRQNRCQRQSGASAQSENAHKQIGPHRPNADDRTESHNDLSITWSWLLVVPFLVIALLCACFPPGSLMPSESHAYDVLEYHLAVPKEHFVHGRIAFLPYNIYSNFPSNAEMLYLLAMILRGSPVEAVYTAQLLHVGLAMLAVAAVWAAARPFGFAPATIAAITTATCPVVANLAGIAYVENGLLAMTAAALACTIRIFTTGLSPTQTIRWTALAGAFAGLAAGFKYTALPMALLPLGIASAWKLRDAPRGRAMSLVAFLLGAAITFSPWLIKNAIATGNPVFPLARAYFPERAGVWNDELARHWSEGHRPAPEQQSLPGIARELVHGVLVSATYGTIVWLLPLLSIAVWLGTRAKHDALNQNTSSPRSAAAVVAIGLTAATLSVWAFATHLISRFAIPLVASQSVLAGLAWRRSRGGRIGVVSVLVAGAAVNFEVLLQSRQDSALFLWPREALGQTDAIMLQSDPVSTLNKHLLAGEHVLLVADAKTFYLHGAPPLYQYSVIFNRNPFAEAAQQRSPAELLDWLKARGIAYVYVDWLEMRRLRGSRYGFWPVLDEALFSRLLHAGLSVEREFRFRQNHVQPDATLFAVSNIPATQGK